MASDFEQMVLGRLEALPMFRSVATETRPEDVAVRVTIPGSGMQAVGDAYESQSRNKIAAMLSILETTLARDESTTDESLPGVAAEVTFLETREGGRKTPPSFTRAYRPHIVIQSPDVRHAVVDADGKCRETYLAVCILNGPSGYCLGERASVTLGLMAHGHVDYGEVQPNATFTIREGGLVVGFGHILDRNDSSY